MAQRTGETVLLPKLTAAGYTCVKMRQREKLAVTLFTGISEALVSAHMMVYYK